MTSAVGDRDPRESRDYFRAFVTMATRWEDVDIYGHVNNVKYYSYFDTAVNRWLIDQDLVQPGRSPVYGIVVETQCTFRRELTFPQDIDVGLAITKLGNSAVSYAIGIFDDRAKEAAAFGHFVHVYIDEQTRRPTAIPDFIRDAFKALQV